MGGNPSLGVPPPTNAYLFSGHSYSAGRMWIRTPALLPWFWIGLGVGSVACVRPDRLAGTPARPT
jgi:hypothetical protein